MQSNKELHLVLAIIMINFVALMNTATINITMTTFIRLFQVDVNTVQWVAIIYLLPLAMMMPLAGYLGERYSYRKVILTGLSGVFIGALGCTFARSFAMLLFFRFLKGMAAGIILPSSVGMVYRYIGPVNQSRYLGYVMLAQTIGMALGPTLAGMILQWSNWHMIFAINLPMSAMAWLAARSGIPEEAGKKEGKVDIFGILQISGGTALFMVAFSKAEEWGWTSPIFLISSGVGIALVIWFILRQMNTKIPLLNFAVLRYRPFVLTMIVVGVLSMSKGVNAMLAQYYLQGGRGYDPLMGGLILLPASIASVLGSMSANALHARGFMKALIVGGLLLTFIGNMGMCNMDMTTSVLFIIICYILRYYGMQLMNMPMLNYGMSSVPKELSGHASSMYSWSNQVVQLVSTNVLTVLMSLHLGRYYAAHGGVGRPLEGSMLYRESLIAGVNMDYVYILVCTGIVLLLSLFVKSNSRKNHPTKKN